MMNVVLLDHYSIKELNHKCYWLNVFREAFIKKKEKDDICHFGGGGGVKNFQNVVFLKVVFKIHFKLF